MDARRLVARTDDGVAESMKWIVALALFGTLGWLAHGLWTEAQKSPVTVRVTVEAPKPPATKPSPKRAATKPAATPRYDGPSQAGDRDNVGYGFATQGIGYQSVL